METFYENDKIEIGLDEAGRGCLFGPVCSAGVVWNGDFHKDIKDSKKLMNINDVCDVDDVYEDMVF
jgi:ribonuclease HII